MLVSSALYKKIQDKLALLRKKQQSTGEDFVTAMNLGDSRENSPLDDAKLKMEMVQKQLEELNKFEELITKVADNSDQKAIAGSLVTLRASGSAHTMKLVLLPSEMIKLGTDFEDHKAVSTQSPIAQLLLGKTSGDMINFESDHGTTEYKITEIRN